MNRHKNRIRRRRIPVVLYVRSANREEQQAHEAFGDAYRAHAQATSGWRPRWSRLPNGKRN